jgi:adenosylcobyric acid synthase
MSIMVQATSSGAGKTTLVAALCRIFSDMGYSVAPFKSQNMSNYSYTGDGFEISQAQALQAFAARTDVIPHMNPILLKPLGNYRSDVFVQGQFYKRMDASTYYARFALKQGMKSAMQSYMILSRMYDLVILEGAGSPAEINLQKYDIANMLFAEKVGAPVLLVSDIERGGSFASLVGTMSLLPKRHQRLVFGFAINKFSGSVEILRPGFKMLKKITKRPVLGVIPKMNLNLPNEDSLDDNKSMFSARNAAKLERQIDALAKTVKSHLDIRAIEKMM